MRYSVKLDVAGTVWHITSNRGAWIAWIKKNYRTFASERPADFAIVIGVSSKCRPCLDQTITTGDSGDSSVLRYCREHFSAAIDFSRRSALIEADTQTGIVDIVRFVISAVLINNKGFLMHAASIMRRGQTYVFAGPSASGKTTLCQTMPGASVLTDETSALVRNGCGYRAHSTCFAGEYGQVRCNVSAPVKSIFFIRKGPRFRHRRLDSCASCTEMLRNCILDFHETTLMRRLLATVDALAGRVPCYELSVSRGGELWRYIDGFVDEVCAQ